MFTESVKSFQIVVLAVLLQSLCCYYTFSLDNYHDIKKYIFYINRPNYQDQDFSEQLQQFKMLCGKDAHNSAEEAEGNTENQHQQRKHHRHSKKKKKKSRDEEQTKHSK